MPEYGSTRLPFVIVGDEAFPLKNYLMRPYSGNMLPDDQEVSAPDASYLVFGPK